MTAAKRTDNRGRILRENEMQRPSGRYEFRYRDKFGVVQAAYSWRLVPTDKTPKNKPETMSLREMEEIIKNDQVQGVDPSARKKYTLNDYFEKYFEIKKNEWKQATRTNNKYLYDHYCRRTLGRKKIAEIKYTDLRKMYKSLIDSGTLAIKTVDNLHTVLLPTFRLAVRDDVILKNPAEGVMADLKKSYKFEKPKRHALTEEQQEAFINYIAESDNDYFKSWLPMMTVFLGTGCRMAELIGLRWDDINFTDNYIEINHNLIYRMQDDGHSEFHITTPKTKAGIRRIPILNAVREALNQEKENQLLMGVSGKDFSIDGYTNFVFVNFKGKPHVPHGVNRGIRKIREAYNEEEMNNAAEENREPLLLPEFSAHHLRHTFATRFCENETNLKVIQEIMGHSDIQVTMNVYNEATEKKKQESFANLEGKIKIS